MDQTPNSKPPDAADQANVCTGELGVWGGLGTSSWWTRLLSLVAGMGYLGLLFDFCLGQPYRDNHLVLSLAALLVAGVLLIVRCFRVRIYLTTVAKTAVPRIQFSIRQLLILTFAVACLVSLGKWLGPDLVPPVGEPFLLALWGLVLATVGLLSVWPALGTRQPILLGMIVMAIAAGLGFCLATLFPELEWALSTTITSVEALSLITSLLVVRACGYRLMRLPVANSRTEHGAALPGVAA